MRLRKQEDIKDCGLYIVDFFAQKFFHKNIDINFWKMSVDYNENGINLNTLKQVFINNSMILETYESEIENFSSLAKSNFPFLVIINNNGLFHYCAVTKIDKNFIWYYDPICGDIIKETMKEFSKKYTKICGFIQPNNEEKYKKMILDNKISGVLSNSKIVIPILLISLLLLILNFGSSFFVKIVFDTLLPNFLQKELFVFFTAFVWINIIQGVLKYIQSNIVKKIENRIQINITNNFLKTLQNSYINKTNKLNISDYLKRFAIIEQVANYQANFTYIILADALSLIMSLTILFFINSFLFAILFSITILVMFINWIFQNFINKQYSTYINKALQKQTDDINILYSLNNFNFYDYKFLLDSKRYISTVEFKEKEMHIFNLNNIKNSILQILNQSNNLIIILVACLLIFKNQLSIGTTLLFINVSGFFISPMYNLGEIISKHTLMEKNIELLNFVFNLPNRMDKTNKILINKIESIILNNVTFGYEQNKPILNNFNLAIDQNIIFKGKNGSGKTTVVNLILNKICDFNGEVFFNDINNKQINIEDLNTKIAYISNSNFMPEISILDLITLGQKKHMEELSKNINKFELNKLINNINLDLNLVLKNNGSNLSNGQKQLIACLQLFIKKYDLVILDEAFENLDHETYEFLKQKIKEYQDGALFIEISHSNRYVHNNKVVDLEKYN